MTEPTKRGGARPGAGRKPSASPKARFNVMLDVTIAAKLRELGAGNLSYGISLAAIALDRKSNVRS